ncbi:MAG: laccase domain-containing protein, partial [Ignavibacteriales bacterium]
MIILKSHLFNQYPEITFGFSTKSGPGEAPYFFNLSLSVGDDPEKVLERRNNFFEALCIKHIAYQKQVHGNTVKYVDHGGYAGESDAMITDKPGLGLLISAADCTSIYIYEKNKKIIAG